MAKTYDEIRATRETVQEALKGDQHKLDHDKDGDIDAKDFQALRNKKKKKKGKDDEVEMNPKLDNGKDDKAEQKEALDKKDVKTVKGVIKGLKKAVATHSSQVKTLTKDIKDNVNEEKMSIRDKLIAVLEGDRAAHYKGATKPQEYEDMIATGAGAKKMVDDHKPSGNVDPKFDGNVAAKATAEAGKKTNQSKKRSNDNDKGDKKIVNPVAGAKMESTDKLAGIKAAYMKMNS